MARARARAITIAVDGERKVSGLLMGPDGADACYVLAHGAGAGMTHPFMAAVAEGLAERGIASLRYNFPYMEQGSKRPDTPKVAHAAVRAAVAESARLMPDAALFAGGKSLGGRKTSQAPAAEPLPGVKGLAFLGFPLHAAGKPGDDRAAHLAQVRVPMLFLQGARDDLAHLPLLEPVVRKLGERAALEVFPDADHSFHVPARSGRKDADVMAALLNALTTWIARIA
jgi:predicted alpha/beta-hydrolase family hydrolase